MTEAKNNRLHGPNLNRKLEMARQVLYFIGVGLNATFWKYSRNFVIWCRRLCPGGVVLREDKFFNIGFADNFFALRFEFEHCKKWSLKRQNIDPKRLHRKLLLASPKHYHMSL
jgi:hypothetical protein